MSVNTTDFTVDTASEYKAQIDANFYYIYNKWMRIVSSGYIAGGVGTSSPAYLGEIDCLSFFNDSVYALSATLSVSRYNIAGVQSSTNGYYAGGYNLTLSPVINSEIDGIIFATETANNPAVTMTTARYDYAGVSSSTHGYFAGGNDGAVSSEIDGITFSDESSYNPAATLAVARQLLTGVQSTTHGYFGGGYNAASSPVDFNEIDGIVFATDAANNPAATLSLSRSATAGVSSSTHGYWCGGTGNFSPITTAEIDGITFATEAAYNPSSALSQGRRAPTGVNSDEKGYICGGDNGAANRYSLIDSILYSTETVTTLTATLIQNKAFMGGVSYK